jgi:hypothetical protein
MKGPPLCIGYEGGWNINRFGGCGKEKILCLLLENERSSSLYGLTHAQVQAVVRCYESVSSHLNFVTYRYILSSKGTCKARKRTCLNWEVVRIHRLLRQLTTRYRKCWDSSSLERYGILKCREVLWIGRFIFCSFQHLFLYKKNNDGGNWKSIASVRRYHQAKTRYYSS